MVPGGLEERRTAVAGKVRSLERVGWEEGCRQNQCEWEAPSSGSWALHDHCSHHGHLFPLHHMARDSTAAAGDHPTAVSGVQVGVRELGSHGHRAAEARGDIAVGRCKEQAVGTFAVRSWGDSSGQVETRSVVVEDAAVRDRVATVAAEVADSQAVEDGDRLSMVQDSEARTGVLVVRIHTTLEAGETHHDRLLLDPLSRRGRHVEDRTKDNQPVDHSAVLAAAEAVDRSCMS